ncbi:hypothetical protein [uncultured Paenibacillus sp.]|uniref:hypothetical protein n=1 Tax=uncultured Paenibacillus sp. TaxID=227322 RepID=UPI0028D67833|nr:hypothetical protein [uncultured Paenibacillus sp.]
MGANGTQRDENQVAVEPRAVDAGRSGEPARRYADADNKRSIFTPIFLILLVISLMGNVSLFAKYLQNGADRQADAGRGIIETGTFLRNDLADIRSELDRLARDLSLEDRMLTKQNLARLTMNAAERMTGLLSAADGQNGREPLGGRLDKAAAFMNGASEALIGIGNHSEPFTAEEQAYIAMLRQSFKTLNETAGPLVFKSESGSNEARQVAAGGDWVDVAYGLADAISANALPPYQAAE